MISLPNNKSILQKIFEYKLKYIKDHGHAPDIIYLDADERKDLSKAIDRVLVWPVTVTGMDLRKQEEYCEHLKHLNEYCLSCGRINGGE
jgi:hypothetical protein